jgi:hypothetical protein
MPRAPASAIVVALTMLRTASADQAPLSLPDLDTEALANGPYSRMRMLLEKTIFRIDVLTVDVRVGEQTRRRLEELSGSAAGAGLPVQQMAATIVEADQVLVTLEFERNVSFDRWLQGVRESLQKARDSRLIQEETFQNVRTSLPEWFGPLVERGFATGDRIVYRGYPDRMHTLVVTAAGDVIVDHTDEGSTPRRAMLAGYFAPGTDFREPLLESLSPSGP